MYIDSQYKSEVKMNLNTYEYWEGLIVQVKGSNLSKTNHWKYISISENL